MYNISLKILIIVEIWKTKQYTSAIKHEKYASKSLTEDGKSETESTNILYYKIPKTHEIEYIWIHAKPTSLQIQINW